MISLQGPESRRILLALIAGDQPEHLIPEPGRNNLCPATIGGVSLTIARTGYTGDPLGFEFFLPSVEAGRFWDRLIALGAAPIGLGARDTLRLEAALPLYGHELGTDHEGREIPIFASPLARFAVSFSALKGDFIGRGPLERQFAAYRSIVKGQLDPAATAVLPRLERPVSLLDPGIARQGAEIFAAGSTARVGWITSGTMAPYWVFTGEGVSSSPSERTDKRAFGIALLDSSVALRQVVEIDVRGRRIRGLVVPYLLRSEAAPYARPIPWGAAAAPKPAAQKPAESREVYRGKAVQLLRSALDNHHWRQEQCINLIPSEMTISPAARLLSISDPAFRYAEHRKVKALLDAEVFYYQGTGFIDEVERLLVQELRSFLGCRQVETRLISGQMANTTVFSALVDYLNRTDRRAEPLRLRSVLNNHIIKGGHLSAQPMGALRDFVARDCCTECAAVTALPVRPDNPYQLDVSRVPEILEQCRPQLVILGKSMIIHREPVKEIRGMIDALGLETVLMYDMAHVLGLVGPHFQEPFKEGADVVTGSTHKTFFGTQRGLVAADIGEEEPSFKLWEAVERRTFPGAVSNHHLGTLVGLLLAAYEMNAFRDSFQPRCWRTRRPWRGRSTRKAWTWPAIRPSATRRRTRSWSRSATGRAWRSRSAWKRTTSSSTTRPRPDEEGFTAAGSLRLGVAEMTRFGMKEKDFRELAGLIAAVVRKHSTVRDEVVKLRSRFLELGYCFSDAELEGRLGEMRKLASKPPETHRQIRRRPAPPSMRRASSTPPPMARALSETVKQCSRFPRGSMSPTLKPFGTS